MNIITITILVLLVIIIIVLILSVKNRMSENKDNKDDFSKNERNSEFKSRDKNIVKNTDVSLSAYSFYLKVEDCFSITGRGAVSIGKIIKGEVKKGDVVYIETNAGEVIEEKVLAIESRRRSVNSATEGDDIGLMLDKKSKQYLERGCKIFKKF
ncbi:MAG: hypothetical protein KBF12_10380 [Sebaldella sp.]|nr:hypothetical protein [Sebaldella sp.]